MKKIFVNLLLLLMLSVWSNAQTVKFVTAKNRIDVLIDGKLFTSYRYEDRLKRPVLYPIMTDGGNFVTRGFPFEIRHGETIDHPHQVGSSLSYGNVNGIDFWNTSTFRTEKELEKMGSILHRKVLKIKNGQGKGELVTQSEWITPKGKTILFETTNYVFIAGGKKRIILRETVLKANDEQVVFGDSKEGMFAIHVARELEQENQIPIKLTDEKGVVSEVKTDERLSGKYLNSEGLAGDKIWGTLGKWASVSGKIGDENVTVAVFDHPKNLNYPSYMMIRGYGLLALNPFGQKAFEPNSDERKFVLEKGKSIKFKHRLVIYSEKTAPEQIEKDFLKFNQ